MKFLRSLSLSVLMLSAAASAGFAADKALPTPHRGVVVETIATTDYIYIRVKADKGEQWLAAPEQALPVGTKIAWSDGAQMTDFKSMRLNRVFAQITFVDVVVKTN